MAVGARGKSVHGQNAPTSGGCISTSRTTGKACTGKRESRYLPYCKKCMKAGDPSLKAVQHPRFGKILIAMRDLPKGYYVGWWGKLLKKKSDMPKKHMEWALETTKGMVDAVPFKGSLLQFCACPGPNEVPTIDFAPNSDCILQRGQPFGTAIFRTLHAVPRNHQVDMMYNKDEKSTDIFFKEQGIKRADVGTKKYPALRKKGAGPPDWEKKKVSKQVMKKTKKAMKVMKAMKAMKAMK
eukprot:TRINITY_DN706_c0_g1_i1.p1 TRINITY_DN706_c0_g1~~TRINITY_DN706_c0_g1_i1.p1  ORF type:complete len:239 (+),score=49.38 TRINITY_DN706_c0_g1_i1:64-780(+)